VIIHTRREAFHFFCNSAVRAVWKGVDGAIGWLVHL